MDVSIPFGVFVVLVLIGIAILSVVILRFTRPREDPYSLLIVDKPSSLGVQLDPDEQAGAAAAGVRNKALRDPKFARQLKQDPRAALLALGLPEAQLDPVLKRLGEFENDANKRVERRFGSLIVGWSEKPKD